MSLNDSTPMEREITEDTSKTTTSTSTTTTSTSSSIPFLLRRVSTLTTQSLPIQLPSLSTSVTTSTNTSQPTIAVSLANAASTNNIIYEEHEPRLRIVESNRSGFQSDLTSEDEISEEYMDSNHQEEEDDDDEDLHSILTDLIRHESRSAIRVPSRRGITDEEEENDDEHMSYLNLNMFPNPDNITNEYEHYQKHIAISKENDKDEFHRKLKHFFIFSTAGKPIYSMNGSDELIVGYMGILTTILSTFEENIHEEIKSINIDNEVKIVALNKAPLVLVCISKVPYEISHSVELSVDHDHDTNENITLINQLNTLYNYLLSILSKPTIERSFQNRLNYDLRRVLTQLDFHNLDSLCMKMTFGLPLSVDKLLYDTSTFDFFISELLDSSLQNVRISNTTRMKLNQILIECKRLKLNDPPNNPLQQKSQQQDDDRISIKSERFTSLLGIKNENDKYLASDLLFAIITTSTGKILSFMKPKNHNLPNEDLKLLFSIIDSSKSSQNMNDQSGEETSEEDMWIPLCMPNFNPNGFLYTFVKTFELEQAQSINVILISSNKNSFYYMRQASNYIINRIKTSRHGTFLEKFKRELQTAGKLSILRDIQVPVIKHFIYKSKKYDQFIMSDFIHFDKSMSSILQLVYFYSSLYNTKATKMKKSNYYNVTNTANSPEKLEVNNFKKLTYSKWNCNKNVITGFMLSDNNYEFYCLVSDVKQVNSKDLISHSLRIIKWCEKNHKRLFIQKGVTV
ncbi:MON1 [[Candida] subhashii]|uniref:Vacuolar fusion protein MON1 n=1 Tax=[Candida] subhashii TaxID=561895 RepID=A0A8J5ULA1_9ASCO|nr:MON1 [[Candida] subhashii]KAG7662686.1 MON1 [[Candida] subhashii]